jgi:hypothetical protein
MASGRSTVRRALLGHGAKRKTAAQQPGLIVLASAGVRWIGIDRLDILNLGVAAD